MLPSCIDVEQDLGCRGRKRESKVRGEEKLGRRGDLLLRKYA